MTTQKDKEDTKERAWTKKATIVDDGKGILYIRIDLIDLNDMLNEVRADAIKQRDAKILEAINSNEKISIDITEHNSKIRADERSKVLDEQWESDKNRIAKQIFDELDQICEIEFGMGLFSVLVQNVRDPQTVEKLTKMGIE